MDRRRKNGTIIYAIETRSALEELLGGYEENTEETTILDLFVSADEFPGETIRVDGYFDVLILVGDPTEQLVRTVIAPRVRTIVATGLTVRTEFPSSPEDVLEHLVINNKKYRWRDGQFAAVDVTTESVQSLITRWTT